MSYTYASISWDNAGSLIIRNCRFHSSTPIDLTLNKTNAAVNDFAIKEFYNNEVSSNINIIGLDDFNYDRKSGTTAQRPDVTLDFIEVGFEYFDTDLGYKIWSNGSDYVNATGGII